MDWYSIEGDNKENIVRKIDAVEPATQLKLDKTTLQQADIPFYHDSTLLHAVNPYLLNQESYYVQTPAEVIKMDGSMLAVHHCNEIGPLALNDSNVYSYLRFLYYFSNMGRLFEARIKRSAVGYTGKLWVFERSGFVEQDVNLTTRGTVTVLETESLPDVPEIFETKFTL